MPLHTRGYLLHLTHYDPGWFAKKASEEPFDPKVGREIVKAIAEEGFDTLLVGVSDGIRYQSHPEWKRHYSRPVSVLKTLVKQARDAGLKVIPKLNFSRSEINTHNHWMRAPGQAWHVDFDDEPYWTKAFEAIDEVIEAVEPDGYFHVGMDEDHDRSHAQYVAAIERLHAGLKKRKLKTLAWSDSALDYASGQHYREKSEAAEKRGPKHTRLLWNYWAVPAKEMKRITRQGHELWGAPGWKTVEQCRAFRDALLAAGGTGMVMTRWMACVEKNRDELLSPIRAMGGVYRGE